MPTLLLHFPAGRYHATPWGHHVNEGLVEWPPAPWRLLRALLATGYSALHWPAEGPPEVARRLILKLAGVLPTYRLPPVSAAHSRHYMPLAVLDKGREKTTLVFDTWANVGDGALVITWNVSLCEDEHQMLAQLCTHLGYLGRSESWVEAQLLNNNVAVPPGEDCYPCELGPVPGRGWEQVSALATLTPEHYLGWRRATMETALADLPELPQPPNAPRGASEEQKEAVKLARKAFQLRAQARALAIAQFPEGLLDALQVTTDWLRKHGWSQPPGSRKVLYWRKTGALEPVSPNPRPSLRRALPVEAMLLSMSTGSGNDHALPTVYRTLPQAELLHRALVSAVKRIDPGPCAVLSGKDADGERLSGLHQHAHLLPLDLDGDQHLEHILIWAPMGLDATAQAAVRSVRRTFTKGGVGDLKLVLTGSGSVQQFARMSAPYGQRLQLLVSPALRWKSLTPFVPPRHLKQRGKDELLEQVRAELVQRSLPEPRSLNCIGPQDSDEVRRMRHFIRRRRLLGPPQDAGFCIEIEFESPVGGPIALGYGCHFGLGVFIGDQQHYSR